MLSPSERFSHFDNNPDDIRDKEEGIYREKQGNYLLTLKRVCCRGNSRGNERECDADSAKAKKERDTPGTTPFLELW
jgi:hypothetical protein